MIYIYALLMLTLLGGALSALLLVADRFLANYGPCKITVNDREPFVIEGGCKLLEALYQRKIFIPSACGAKGTCGFCKLKVLDGGGPLLPTELPYLTPDEIASSTRLACQIKVKKDIVTSIREDYLNIQEFRAVVESAEMVTHDTRELVFKLISPTEMKFKPGQYVQVQVPAPGETVYRAYSVSSAPGAKERIELLVRLVPGGLGSTYLHKVRAGEEVMFTGPYGEFTLDGDADTEVICVGGGCGLAPIRCIVQFLHKTAPRRKCLMFFGARTPQDLMYVKEFEKLAAEMPQFSFHFAISEPKRAPGWKGETGFIHESVAKHVGNSGKRQAFLCGPKPMIDATMRVLKEKGVPRDRVFFDEF